MWRRPIWRWSLRPRLLAVEVVLRVALVRLAAVLLHLCLAVLGESHEVIMLISVLFFKVVSFKMKKKINHPTG